MSATPAERAGAHVVLRRPYVPLVLTAAQIGRLPLAASPLALLLFARESLSLVVSGALVAVFTAGMAVGAPVLARAVDRWRQPPILYGSALLSAVGYLIAAQAPGRPLMIGLGAALAGLGTPPLEACLRALWPALVPPSMVHAAYALDVALQEIIFVAGPLVTLGAVAMAGPSAGLYAAALLQLIGVLRSCALRPYGNGGELLPVAGTGPARCGSPAWPSWSPASRASARPSARSPSC